MRKAGALLVTGGAGFIGSNLADHLAGEGHRVLVLDSLRRPGVQENLAWLCRRHPDRIAPIEADVRDRDAVRRAVGQADAVFHLAAQVAVTTSLTDPAEDFGTNLLGTFELLEAVRLRPGGPCPLVFASTNKVYGGLADAAMQRVGQAWMPRDAVMRAGVAESHPLDFRTPYGCSKGAADQYVLDYARSFGLPFVVLRMSCVYGPRQMGTEDQGWVAHFLRRALRDEPITLFGDGLQVRDILHVQDAVACWVAAWRRAAQVPGSVFNLGGGPANAVSLLQVLEEIERITGHRPRLRHEQRRASDQCWYVSDTRRAARDLGFETAWPWREGLRDLAHWLAAERAAAALVPT